jgi:hypothetical protein
MKFLAFEFVDIFKVDLPAKPTKEEKEYMTSVRIVYNTKMLKPLKIRHLEPDDQEADNAHQSTTITAIKHVKGTAIKLKDCWKLFFNDGREL